MSKSDIADMVEADMKMTGMLLYLLGKDNPKDYILLFAIKTFRYMTKFVHKDKLKGMFGLADEDIDPMLKRLKDDGLIVVNGTGHLEPTPYGDKEFHRIRGHVAMVMANIKDRKPVNEWTNIRRLTK